MITTSTHRLQVREDQSSSKTSPSLTKWLLLTGKLKYLNLNREVIPERVVHAKGAGAHGYFEVTNDVTKYTKAKFLDTVGKQTPMFIRFSTVGGEKGSADTVRDPRGFAVKFYTEEGNYDLVGNNTPVFFVHDPIKFPEFIHTQKRNPVTNLKDCNMQWDFWSKHTEAMHQVMILFSDRGTPDGYRFMNGYGSHTFKWTNADDESFFIKYHFKVDQGIKNLSAEEAHKLTADNPDYATQDLYEAIERGEYPSWTLKVQIMPEAEGEKYKWDIYDVTKVWPHSDYPLIEVGKMVLNKNPKNFHIEVEQSAFSPSHLVPGIEMSNDRLLQGRLFSYPDTHRHRLGPNSHMLEINCPYRTRVNNYQIGGDHARFIEEDKHIYEGSTNDHPAEAKHACPHAAKVEGTIGRYPLTYQQDHFAQPGELYRKVFDDGQKKRVAETLGGNLSGARKDLQEKMIEIFKKIDENLGKDIEDICNKA